MLAFQEAFPKIGQAVLTIKTSPDCDWISPREDIIIINEFMSHRDLLSLYSNNDGYISASLAEGLGLPVAEAVRSGLPVAANFWGGHRDILQKGSFFPIDYKVVDQPFCSKPEYYAQGQRCAFSDPHEIASTMIRMMNSTARERKEMAMNASDYFAKGFSQSTVNLQISNRVCELQKRLK